MTGYISGDKLSNFLKISFLVFGKKKWNKFSSIISLNFSTKLDLFLWLILFCISIIEVNS